MVKPLALAKKAPKVDVLVDVPKVRGGKAPKAPVNATYRKQLAAITKQGYAIEDAEDIVKEQFDIEPPLEFSKGGLVGTKIKAPKIPKPKGVKVARISTSLKAPAAPKAKVAKVVR